jgi:hypothetical protein
MKRMVFLLSIFIIPAAFVSAQKLLDIYKNGPVKLVADKTYGANNNWETLFNLYYDTLGTYDRPRGNDKGIAVAPDGSVFMSHKNRHEIWKFGPDGNFIKSFGSKGGKAYQFPMLPTIQKVVDGKYVFTCDVNARLKFFDLEGNYFKSITLDYMAGGFQPLGNGKLMLEGNVLWDATVPGSDYSSHKWRHIIVILDIYTGAEKIIYDFFEPGDIMFPTKPNNDSLRSKRVPTPENKIYLPNYMVYKKPVFIPLKTGQSMVFNRGTGEVKFYSETGKVTSSFKLDITPVAISENDALKNYESTRKYILKSINQARLVLDSTRISKGERGTTPGNVIKAFPNSDEIIKRGEEALTKMESYKDINRYFPNLPYFSNIITDDEGNLLVFEFTSAEEKETNIFNVIAYDSNGQKLARTSFICEDYDLDFSGNHFVISKGNVYAVAKLKNITGMPLRLVKFKITN